MSRYCKFCDRNLPVERFSRKGEGRATKCKDCHNTYIREVWYVKNRDKQKRASAEWKIKNRAKVIAVRYKADEDTIQKLLDIGKCQICGQTENLHIDHCHSTGEIRGILCRGCNHGLGNFYDDPNNLRRAAEYLETVQG